MTEYHFIKEHNSFFSHKLENLPKLRTQLLIFSINCIPFMCYQWQNKLNTILLIPKTAQVPKEHEFLALLFRKRPKERALGVNAPTWPCYLEIYKRFCGVNCTDAVLFWTRPQWSSRMERLQPTIDQKYQIFTTVSLCFELLNKNYPCELIARS